MQKLFPIRDQGSIKNQTQSKLLIVAGLFLLCYATILTLAPAVRFHAGSERYQFQHWVGVLVWGIAFSLLHYQTTQKLPNGDPYILPVIAFLSSMGLMTIWRLYPNLGIRQTIWLLISSTLVFLGLQFPDYIKILRRYKYFWLTLGLLLTGLTIVLGTHPLGTGSARWLRLFGIHFQPSEPLKLLLIIYLAGFFSDRLSAYHRKIEVFIPTVILTGIGLLLLIFQRDLGTATILLLIYLTMLFTTRGDRNVFWVTPILFLAAGIAGYFFVDIVGERIGTWLNPFGDPSGASYQIIQSMVAIAEGDLIGTGPGLGSPGLIPVSVSDFIFSAIAEELGFLGVSIVILLFSVLLYRGIRLALQTENSFHRYLTLGLIFYFGIQTILIIGGNIGLLPLTGVTLPFLSYGGSSLFVSFGGMLFLLTISQETGSKPQEKTLHQPRYAMIGLLLILILIIQIVVTSLLAFWFNPNLVNRPENPRWIIDDRFSKRGDILDRDNHIIKTNIGEIGEFTRSSNHVPLYPVIGFTHPIFGQTGIEASMYPYLRGNTGYPFSTIFWQDLLYNQPPEGLDVRLTIELDLQRAVDNALIGHAGAVVIMNANSGEILAMASHPYFDAADLQTQWEDLVEDQSGPLINRATQGLYPPGSTLFPFMITSQRNLVQQFTQPEDRFHDLISDPGCALPPAEPLTWQTLVANGCQNAQLAVAETIGADALRALYQDLGFFTAPSLHLPVADTTIPDSFDPITVYLGQDTFNVSPLQMAMAASTLSNQGVLPGPRIVNAVEDPQEGWTTVQKLQSNSEVMTSETVNWVNQMLQVENAPYWQVISVVKTIHEEDITWFIAGTSTDWQGQPITTVVLIENDVPELVQEIGRSLIEQATRFLGQNP